IPALCAVTTVVVDTALWPHDVDNGAGWGGYRGARGAGSSRLKPLPWCGWRRSGFDIASADSRAGLDPPRVSPGQRLATPVAEAAAVPRCQAIDHRQQALHRLGRGHGRVRAAHV